MDESNFDYTYVPEHLADRVKNWRNLSIGERFVLTSELSEAAWRKLVSYAIRASLQIGTSSFDEQITVAKIDGTRKTIDRILQSSILEAIEIRPEHRIDIFATMPLA
jgi:hypothetical protein